MFHDPTSPQTFHDSSSPQMFHDSSSPPQPISPIHPFNVDDFEAMPSYEPQLSPSNLVDDDSSIEEVLPNKKLLKRCLKRRR